MKAPLRTSVLSGLALAASAQTDLSKRDPRSTCSDSLLNGFDFLHLDPLSWGPNFGGLDWTNLDLQIFGKAGWDWDSIWNGLGSLGAKLGADIHAGLPGFSYGGRPFYLNEIEISAKVDIFLNINYIMPDNKKCVQTIKTGPKGSKTKNDKCGGAVGIEFGLLEGLKLDADVEIAIGSMNFNCDPSITTKTHVWTQGAELATATTGQSLPSDVDAHTASRHTPQPTSDGQSSGGSGGGLGLDASVGLGLGLGDNQPEPTSTGGAGGGHGGLGASVGLGVGLGDQPQTTATGGQDSVGAGLGLDIGLGISLPTGSPFDFGDDDPRSTCSDSLSKGFDFRHLDPLQWGPAFGGLTWANLDLQIFGKGGWDWDSLWKGLGTLGAKIGADIHAGLPGFSYGGRAFYLNEIEIAAKVDVSLNINYIMPNHKKCVQTIKTGPKGSKTKNDKCGGAIGIELGLLEDVKLDTDLEIAIGSINFDCNPPSGKHSHSPVHSWDAVATTTGQSQPSETGTPVTVPAPGSTSAPAYAATTIYGTRTYTHLCDGKNGHCPSGAVTIMTSTLAESTDFSPVTGTSQSTPTSGHLPGGDSPNSSPTEASPASGLPTDVSPASGSPTDVSPASGSPTDVFPASGSPTDTAPTETPFPTITSLPTTLGTSAYPVTTSSKAPKGYCIAH